MSSKLKNLKNITSKNKLDAFLISNPYSIFYLSGFKGAVPEDREAYLVFNGSHLNLFAPRLYQNEALSLKSADLNVTVVPERNEFYTFILDSFSKVKGSNIGFESEDLKYSEFSELEKGLKKKKLVPKEGFIASLRECKVEEEVEFIRKAQEISYKALDETLPMIRVGISELEMADVLRKAMIGLGAEGESFGSIVAVNEHAALPHHQTSNTKVKKGDLILIDWGAKYKGYCGDSTRVLVLGKPSDVIRKTHALVVKAHDEGIKAVKAGAPTDSVYQAANAIFEKVGVSDKFIHGLGHGIGMAVHEPPYIRRTSKEPLKEGQVFSIEPGLYYPEWGGVRIEDLVVCRKNKAQVLGSFSTALIEL